MNDRRSTFGLLLFVLGVGIPGAHLSGFFGGSGEIPFAAFLAMAVVAGAIGGLLMGRGAPLAGALAGMIAGACGLVAVHFYTTGRDRVHTIELVAVQGAASLPAIGIYFLIRKLTGAGTPPSEAPPGAPPPAAS